MDEERFILEVERHKMIYNTTHPFYKDINRKAMIGNGKETPKRGSELLFTPFLRL